MEDTSGESGAFLGKAGPLVLARLVSAGLTLAIPLALARTLPLGEYGTYKQLWLVAQTLYFVLTFGVPQSLYFFVPRTVERRPLFVQTLTFLLAAGGLACGLLYAGAGGLARLFSNPELQQYRLTLGIYTGALLASFPLEISLTTQGRTDRSAIAYLASDAVRTAAMTLPILFGFGLSGMMLAMAAFALLRLGTAWWVCLRGSRGPAWSWSGLRSQLAYAAPFGLAMALAIPQQYAHQYAVSSVVAPAAFALYAAGCFQLPLVDLLYTPTSEVLMVRIGELERAGRVHEALFSFRQATSKLAYVFLPMAACLFACAPDFIQVAFGARFLPAAAIFRVSVIGVVLASAPMDGVLRARNQTRHILISYALKALVTVPLVYIGVRRFGLMGGIASWAIAECVGKAALFVRIPAALSTPSRPARFRDVLPWGDLGRAAVGAGVAAAAVLAGRRMMPDGPWRMVPLAASGALFTAVYCIVLWMTGVRPAAVLATFWRRKPRAPLQGLPRTPAAP